MNLKEAFRYQNVYYNLMQNAVALLRDKNNYRITKDTYLYSAVDPDTEDKVVVSEPTDYSENINELISFTNYLFNEKLKLTAAIDTAKNRAEYPIDYAVATNKERYSLLNSLQVLNNVKDTKRTGRGVGTGYKFNINNEQVPFRCDVIHESTAIFDRKLVKSAVQDLSRTAQATSQAIDEALINTQVDYEPSIDILESFENIFADYLESLNNPEPTE